MNKSLKLYTFIFILLFSFSFTACNYAKPVEENKTITSNSPKIDKPIEGISSSSKDEDADIRFKYKDTHRSSNAANKAVKYTDIDPAKAKIPVLMYHSINENSTNSLIIKPEEFAAEMKWLNDQGYTPLSLDELYGILTTGKNCPDKPVVITFDDGYRDNYDNAYPILKKYGFKATIFVITKYIDQPDCLTTENIKEMFNNNIDFESHTDTHSELSTLNYAAQLKELVTSRYKLSALLGKGTEYLCYPSGKYNNDTIKADAEAGYKMSFTTKPGFANKSYGLETIPRIRMYPGINMAAIRAN